MSMTSRRPDPPDFAIDFTPGANADLHLWIVDERPPSPTSLRGIARRVRGLLRGESVELRDTNDAEAEHAWAEIGANTGPVDAHAFESYIAEKFAQDYLRRFEYPFLVRCLGMSNVSTGVVVDMGGGNSYSTVVPLVLRLEQSRILSVDVVNHSVRSKYGVEYVCGDCIDTTLRAAFADVVTLVSTLEHVGLGRWGDPLDIDGDVKAMREAWRILRPGGHVVLTIPYGHPTVVFNLHRIYDKGRVSRLTEGFEIVIAEYTLFGEKVPRENVEGKKVTPGHPGHTGRKLPDAAAPQIPGGAMFLLRKPVGD